MAPYKADGDGKVAPSVFGGGGGECHRRKGWGESGAGREGLQQRKLPVKRRECDFINVHDF